MRLHRGRRRSITDPLLVLARLGHRSNSFRSYFRSTLLRRSALLCRSLLGRRLFRSSRLRVRAEEIHAGLKRLLQQIRALALRTLLRHRLVVRRKVALRIIRAAPEDVPSSRLALSQIALAALRELHPLDQVLLHILALRITGAGHKLPISPVTQHQFLAAQRAILTRRLRSIQLLLLLLAQLANRLARRILV